MNAKKILQSHVLGYWCVLTQCRSLRVWVCGGPPCHQLKPKEETMSVTFPTAFSRACLACSAPSSDPGIERGHRGKGPRVRVQLSLSAWETTDKRFGRLILAVYDFLFYDG